MKYCNTCDSTGREPRRGHVQKTYPNFPLLNMITSHHAQIFPSPTHHDFLSISQRLSFRYKFSFQLGVATISCLQCPLLYSVGFVSHMSHKCPIIIREHGSESMSHLSQIWLISSPQARNDFPASLQGAQRSFSQPDPQDREQQSCE